MNCEFCGREKNSEFDDFPFHKDCLKRAIDTLARLTQEPKIGLVDMSDNSWMVMMDPRETMRNVPREVFSSFKQAVAVAKDLTKKCKKPFWVIKHVVSTTIA